MRNNIKQVYILTWCGKPEYMYGATLTFRTLRVGFPSANISVVDNASLQDCREEIKQAAMDVGARYTQLNQAISHHEFIDGIIRTQTDGSVIFLDPDLCFWKNIENWHFDKLVAGRRIPKFHCEYTNCITHSRLHTSFLWIPDVVALREAIIDIKDKLIDFEPFKPHMFKIGSSWHRQDTGANLFSAIEQDDIHCFTENELNSYDHLFCGTHFGDVSSSIDNKYSVLFEKLHNEVKNGKHEALKGAWQLQDKYFEYRKVKNN